MGPEPFHLGYRPALDGLRGVAILAVMLGHSGLLTGGWLGVDVFFTLSGFLITSLLLEEHARTGSIRFRTFYARRALRLLPALFLMVGVCGPSIIAASPPRLVGKVEAPYPLRLALAWSVTFAVCVLSFRFVEAPALKLKSRLADAASRPADLEESGPSGSAQRSEP